MTDPTPDDLSLATARCLDMLGEPDLDFDLVYSDMRALFDTCLLLLRNGHEEAQVIGAEFIEGIVQAHDHDFIRGLARDLAGRIGPDDKRGHQFKTHCLDPTLDLAGIPADTVYTDPGNTLTADPTATASPQVAASPQVQVSRQARKLTGAATGLLPIEHRARYNEEFAAELWDLAAAGAGRRQQLAYATRQLVRALHLRAALTPHSLFNAG
ncbi:hypothetical protein GCM10027589_17100 [Actinocorallia lasiicapitis]